MKKKNEIIDKWISDLRSCKYEQGFGQLWHVDHQSGKVYTCALGVLYDQRSSFGKFIDYYVPGRHPYMWLGRIISESECGRIATMNDCQQKNFCEIADFVERKLK